MTLSDFNRGTASIIKGDLTSNNFDIQELTDTIHWEMIRTWAEQLVKTGILPPYEQLEQVLTYIKFHMR